jgi:hypothetical protein
LTAQWNLDAAVTILAATLLVAGVVVTVTTVTTPTCYMASLTGPPFECILVENAGLGLLLVGAVGLALSWMNARIKRRGRL